MDVRMSPSGSSSESSSAFRRFERALASHAGVGLSFSYLEDGEYISHSK